MDPIYVVIYSSVFWLWTSNFYGAFWMSFVVVFHFRWTLLKKAYKTTPLLGSPVPGKRQLFWVLFRWI